MTPCVNMQEGAQEELSGVVAAVWNAPLRPRWDANGALNEPADDAAESNLMESACSFTRTHDCLTLVIVGTAA